MYSPRTVPLKHLLKYELFPVVFFFHPSFMPFSEKPFFPITLMGLPRLHNQSFRTKAATLSTRNISSLFFTSFETSNIIYDWVGRGGKPHPWQPEERWDPGQVTGDK